MPFIENEEYFDYLKGKRVALVGPAKSVEGTRQGSVIDDYDVVVRIKSIYIPPSMVDDLGSRGDILYTDNHETNDIMPGDEVIVSGDKSIINPSEVQEAEPMKFKYICSAYPQGEWFFDRFVPSLNYLSDITRVRITKDDPYFEVKKHTNRPNAGFAALIDLLTTPLSELYITGIDFYRTLYRGNYLNSKWTSDTVKRMAHDHDGVDPKTGKKDRHEPDLQFKYFKYDMYLKDKRIKLDPFLTKIIDDPRYEKCENVL